MTPAVLSTLGFAASEGAVVAVSLGVNPRMAYTHRRKRPYAGWMIVLRPVNLFRGLRLRWA